jgi:DNA topoisomerase-2
LVDIRIHAKVGDRWEICVSLSSGQFQQVTSDF